MSGTTTPLVALCRFEMGGVEHHPGDTLAVSEATAQRLVAHGLARATVPPSLTPIPLADALGALKGKPPAQPVRARKALSVCSTPGCPELVPRGRCPRCSTAARRKPLPQYDRAAWRRTRAAFLAAHPYCMCDTHAALPEIARPVATEVDHIDGLGVVGPRGHDWSNLRSMTKSCHSRRTAMDQPGGWHDRG